jgi:Anti-sigma regulatory factor (Ser/Thr protein kinase)
VSGGETPLEISNSGVVRGGKGCHAVGRVTCVAFASAFPVTPDSRKILTLRNDLAELPRLAAFVDEFCDAVQPGEDDRMALQLVLEEAVTNVINHGYADGQGHEFTVTLQLADEGRVCAVVTDDAAPYDPLTRPPVDVEASLEDRQVGGLGVHLMKRLTQHAHYERRDGKNVLTLERAIRRVS